jgi:hypothetical protein
MRSYWSSTTAITDNVISHCNSALADTVADPVRADRLDNLGKLASALEAFVRGYERIDDDSISTDDEILNWAFSETSTDFCSAIWLLASGFYKASASSLRNALDIATASLYFQIRENENTARSGYNRLFAEWDRGDRKTPNWGEMKPYISAQPSVASFKSKTGMDLVQVAYEHFSNLCAYTHTAAYADNGEPVTAINMTGVAPTFDGVYFNRGCVLTNDTISLIAILWQVVFPGIIGTLPLGPLSGGVYAPLFPPPVGPLALLHK